MKFVLSAAFSPVGELPALARAPDQHQWLAMSFPDCAVNPETIATHYPCTEDGSRRWQAFSDWPDPWMRIGALTIPWHLYYGEQASLAGKQQAIARFSDEPVDKMS